MNFDNGNNQDFEQPTAGTKPGRLVGLYDIGIQPGKPFNGEPAKDRRQVVFVFELVGKEKQSDGKPFQISKFATVSLHKKGNFVPIIKALGINVKTKSNDWYEAPTVPLSNALGEPVMVSVEIAEDGGKAFISSINAPIDGMVFAEPVTSLGYLDQDEEGWRDQYAKAPAWIQKMCQRAIDWESRY